MPALKLYRVLGRPAEESGGQTRIGENPLSGIAGGGLWKRMRYGNRTEAHREIDGYATGPYEGVRATFISRHIELWLSDIAQ